MSLYSFYQPVRLLSGLDSLIKASETIKDFGERVLLFSESSLKTNLQYQAFISHISRLGCSLIHFDDIETCHSVDNLHSVLTKVRASRPHVLVAIGGIRTLGIARIVAHLANSKTSIERFLAGEQVQEAPLKLINVPSSGRDPFCSSSHILLGESFIGRPLWLQQNQNPVVMSVFDPKVHMGIPQKQAVLFLYDHLLLCSDILASSNLNPIAEHNAKGAMVLGVHALRSLAGQSKDLKTNLEACSAGALAVLAMGASQPGLGYAVVTVLHTRFKVPKSLAASIILPYLLELYAAFKGEHFTGLAQSLGVDTDGIDPSQAAIQAAQALRRISSRCGFPSRLGDLRIGQDQIQETAALVLDLPFVRLAPMTVSHSVVIDLLRRAL